HVDEEPECHCRDSDAGRFLACVVTDKLDVRRRGWVGAQEGGQLLDGVCGLFGGSFIGELEITYRCPHHGWLLSGLDVYIDHHLTSFSHSQYLQLSSWARYLQYSNHNGVIRHGYLARYATDELDRRKAEPRWQ